jgi:hypothetical protein
MACEKPTQLTWQKAQLTAHCFPVFIPGFVRFHRASLTSGSLKALFSFVLMVRRFFCNFENFIQIF